MLLDCNESHLIQVINEQDKKFIVNNKANFPINVAVFRWK